MPTVEGAAVSKAGIATSASGERHIPASRRADGSLRKEIRVRPGYRPPEDVEVYKNRTSEAWKNRGSTGIPGAAGLKDEAAATQQSAAGNKNAKRREARKKAAAAASATEDQAVENATKAANAAEANQGTEAPTPAPDPVDPEVQREKEAKKLLKKLRQARDLKDKKEKGAALLPEQFEKVIKINELIRQLEGLGFDSNGDKKPES
jgi:partner of Y14 and mago protein